jgi:peptidoglycan/xylan/chitin deacetylase (PgdA/CDA1 family)
MILIPNKREFLARRMRDTGVLRLIERAARRPALLVLTYHRIGDPSRQPYYAPIASASADAFAQQIQTLRDTHRVLALDALADLAARQFRVDEPTAVVTFDDGYRDNIEVALPILRSHGVPATFFLPTRFLQAPMLPWWDHVAYVINHCRMSVLRIDLPVSMAVELDPGAGPQTAAIARVVRACLDHHVEGDPEFRAHLEARAGVTVDEAALGRDLFMTWDQARALVAAGAGMSVGSHAHSHRKLARLPEEEQRFELTESKRILEAELKTEIRALAYPYGWPGAFDETTLRLAREVGYGLAFSSVEGVNRPAATDAFAIARLGVGFADSPVLLRARLALYSALGRSLV